jgi:uracil-DNA glycosylase
MFLQTVWDYLEKIVLPIPSEAGGKYPCFNLYSATNITHDQPNADQLRCKNLHSYLKSFQKAPQILAVGEAPGWRGCRFSGVPFTSEAQFLSHDLPFQGTPTSCKQLPYKESSATIYWSVIERYHPEVFTWNCVPVHLHTPGKPLSNRKPTRGEIEAYQELLSELIRLLQPSTIVAVGRSAEQALKGCGMNPIYVRHPSHGGSREFAAGMENAIKA